MIRRYGVVISQHAVSIGRGGVKVGGTDLIGEKYHVEHFTCSECDVVFGPNDSYYEHGSKVCECRVRVREHS